MSSLIVKPSGDEHAYEMIEAAVMETSRGRWFLAEYARRHRHAETVTILQAIERLQNSLAARGSLSEPAAAPAPAPAHPAFLPLERLQFDIMDMARAIARTEREIRAIRPDGVAETQFVSASDELDAVVSTTEQATSSILSAAERIQEFAWEMRERHGKAEECDLLDRCATEIYTACGFQDLTAQRIRTVVETLRFLDERLKSLLEVAGLAEDFQADEKMIEEMGEPAPAPAQRASDIWMSEAPQAEIDDAFEFFTPAEAIEPTMIGAELLDLAGAPEPEPAPSPRRRKAKAGKTESGKTEADKTEAAAPAIAAPAAAETPAPSPYDGLATEAKIRAFR
jgi:chemotaxis regulatin CheY-phosphate phosphatase CheZ